MSARSHVTLPQYTLLQLLFVTLEHRPLPVLHDKLTGWILQRLSFPKLSSPTHDSGSLYNASRRADGVYSVVIERKLHTLHNFILAGPR